MGLVKPVSPVLQRDNPQSRGLVAGLPFYEGSGATLYDLSGRSNSFAIQNAAPWIGSPYGSALSLDGVNQHASRAAIDVGNAFTLEALVYAVSSTNVSSIISKEFANPTSAVAYVLGFGLASGTNLGFGFYDGSWRLVGLSGTFPAGAWTHVCGTWDGTTASLYINGALNSSATPGGTTANDTNQVFIGRRHDGVGGAPYFNGRIAGAKIYNRALSAAEVATSSYDPFAIYRPRSRWWGPFAAAVRTPYNPWPLAAPILAQ